MPLDDQYFLWSLLLLTPLSLAVAFGESLLVVWWMRRSARSKWNLPQLALITGLMCVWTIAAVYAWEAILRQYPPTRQYREIDIVNGPLQRWIAIYIWPVFALPAVIYYWCKIRRFTLREMLLSFAVVSVLLVIGMSVYKNSPGAKNTPEWWAERCSVSTVIDGRVIFSGHGSKVKEVLPQLHSIANTQNIQQVSLERCNLVDHDLAYIAPLHDLRILSLGENPVTDDGIQHIAECQSLEILSLYKTNITDAALPHLAHLSKLQVVDLRGTRVTSQGVDDLRKKVGKQVRVEWP